MSISHVARFSGYPRDPHFNDAAVVGIRTCSFLFFNAASRGTHLCRYSIYLHINPRPNSLLVEEFLVHLPAGS